VNVEQVFWFKIGGWGISPLGFRNLMGGGSEIRVRKIAQPD